MPSFTFGFPNNKQENCCKTYYSVLITANKYVNCVRFTCIAKMWFLSKKFVYRPMKIIRNCKNFDSI